MSNQAFKMAGSNLVNGTIKCLTLPAALVGTIQAVVWLTLSLISILYHNNVIEVSSYISSTSYGYIIYYLYLRPGEGLSSDLIINPNIFIIIMYIYLALSFLWLLVSIYMIWVAIRKKWDNISKALLCWSIVTIVLAVLDVSLMGVLASDLHTAHNVQWSPTQVTTTNTDPIINMSNKDAIMKNVLPTLVTQDVITEKEIYTTIGIVMSLAARGYILWILNVVFAIIFTVSVCKSRKSTRPSLMQRPIIDAYDMGRRPFSVYDQVEIDKSFQNEAFQSDESNIFSPRSNEVASNNNNNNYSGNFNNNNNRNPLSNSNRSSLAFGQNPPYIMEVNKQLKIPPAPHSGKLAKIGKSGGRRSPPQPVPSPTVPHLPYMPYIPEPDYTPPGSLRAKPKGVLRPGSKYAY